MPDVQVVVQSFIPALGLQNDPATAAHLIEQAAVARGERPPASVTHQRTVQVVLQAEYAEHIPPVPPLALPVIGRKRDVQQISNRLLDHAGRLLTLIGLPGVGKTTLALAVAKNC